MSLSVPNLNMLITFAASCDKFLSSEFFSGNKKYAKCTYKMFLSTVFVFPKEGIQVSSDCGLVKHVLAYSNNMIVYNY